MQLVWKLTAAVERLNNDNDEIRKKRANETSIVKYIGLLSYLWVMKFNLLEKFRASISKNVVRWNQFQCDYQLIKSRRMSSAMINNNFCTIFDVQVASFEFTHRIRCIRFERGRTGFSKSIFSLSYPNAMV